MSEKIVKNTIIVLVLIVLGKLLSFFSEIVISYTFGATSVTDAYFAANNIPSLLFTALISSYLVLLIPTYKKIQFNLGNDVANKFGSSLINFMLIISILLSAAGYFFMGFLIKFIAPGFNSETHLLALTLGKILVLSFPFSGITLVLSTMSNANKKYYATHIIPIFSSSFIIVGLFLYATTYGIYTLAISGVLAFVFQLVFQIVISKKYFKYKINASVLDANIKKMTILALPILLGYSIDQINLLINSMICSNLSEGNLSALTYAQRLQFTLLGTVSTALITVVYPLMSDLVTENNKEQLIKLINRSVRGIILIMLPIALFFAINSELVVSVIFRRGNFDAEAVFITSEVFFFYAINVFLLSMREFILRVFYVYDNTKSPLISSGISVTVNIVLSLLLVRFLGVAGLSLANLIATLLSLLILVWFLSKKQLLHVNIKSIFTFFREIALPITFFVLMQVIIKENTYGVNKYLMLFVTLFISIISYYCLLLLFKQREVLVINKKIKKEFQGFSSKIIK